MRTWLNSDAGEGQAKYIIEDDVLSKTLNAYIWDYNALVAEVGFISAKNFSKEEVRILKESQQRDPLIGKYSEQKEGGSQPFKFQDTNITVNASLDQKSYYRNNCILPVEMGLVFLFLYFELKPTFLILRVLHFLCLRNIIYHQMSLLNPQPEQAIPNHSQKT